MLSHPEIEHPGVFKKTANDRSHADVVGQAWNLGRQHAGTPHNEINADPALPRLHQSTDQGLVRQGVHLDDNARILATAGSLGHLVNFLQHAPLQMKRRQDQLAQLGRAILTGQMAEDTIHVRSDFLIGRQIAQIRIQTRRAHVVVAGR